MLFGWRPNDSLKGLSNVECLKLALRLPDPYKRDPEATQTDP